MPTPLDFEAILARRDEVFRQLASLGDLRPGSLVARFRKCGKPNCHCAAEGAPGHGPSWSLTRGVRGKTVTRVIPADAVEETCAQIEECRRLRRLTGELIEVSEQYVTLVFKRLAMRRRGPQVKKSLRGAVRPRDRGRGRPAGRPGSGRQAGLRGAGDRRAAACAGPCGARGGARLQRGPLRPCRPAPALPVRQRGALRRTPPQDLRDRAGAADPGTRLLLLPGVPPGLFPARPAAGA